MLSREEQNYYNRHLLLEDIAEEGQLALKNSHVVVIGGGGLGSPVLSYLAGAGVGHLAVVDGDRVGAVSRMAWRSLLPYRVRFEVTTTRVSTLACIASI